MKYVAKHAPDESDDADHEWLVEYEDGDHLVELNGLRDSEAHIIAWALSAVAQGLVLQAFHEFDDLEFAMAYDGPTDGVTPSC